VADVFISYKREDRRHAERLSIVLEQLGFEVWWDFDLLSGESYRTVIKAVIDQCKAAVVLWSQLAVQSSFVMDEAEYARTQGKLCPIRLDDVALPFGFGALHTGDLSQWDGEIFNPDFQNVVRAIEARTGKKGRLGAAGSSGQAAQAAAAELESFKAAQLAGNDSALRAFLARHPQGAFSGFVKSQLESIEAETKLRERIAAEAVLAERARHAPPEREAPADQSADRSRRSPPRLARTTRPKATAPEPAREEVIQPVEPDPPIVKPTPAPPRPKSNGWIFAAVGVVAVLVAVVGGGAWYMMQQVSNAKDAARDAYAARFNGVWAPQGLSCEDSSVRITAQGGVFTMTPAGGAPASYRITAVNPGGDLTMRGDDGQTFVDRLDGDTLTRQSPDGSTAAMVRCHG
jgi:hypothetical protein